MLEGILVILGVIPFVLLVAGISAVYNGWVLSILWGWFAVKIFGAPVLTIWQAAGLMVLINFLHKDVLTNLANKPNAENQNSVWITMTLGPLFALLFGWLLHFFV